MRWEKRLAPLPLLTGGFALIFGVPTIMFHDPDLLKIKLSIQNGLLAAVLLGSLPLSRYPFKYLLGEAIKITDRGLARPDPALWPVISRPCAS